MQKMNKSVVVFLGLIAMIFLVCIGCSKTAMDTKVELEAGDTWTEPNTGMEFVYVPGGCYQMGCGSWTDSCDDDEKPVHEVCVDGFWISKYEVTIDEYRDFLLSTGDTDGVDWGDSYCPIEKGGSYSLSGNKFGQEGDQPITEVSWHGARAFAEWMSRQSGKEIRLPTEAEWEYAARSGGKEQKFAGGDYADELAWYGESWSNGSTHDVGTKSPNDLDIFDMSGNVWEWCSDWYSSDYYANSPEDNPQGPETGSHRVIRGGSWGNNAEDVRTVARDFSGPSGAYNFLGLRLVRTE